MGGPLNCSRLFLSAGLKRGDLRQSDPWVFLDRFVYGQQEPVARIKYTGNWDDWEFAIFKWSSETYDADECFFPGSECLDGSIKGALKAGMRAYPIEDKSNPEGLFAELGQFFMCVFAFVVFSYSFSF